VQEYKNAESAVARTFSPPDIKQIAIATLEILVYLQAQKPPIIHRDIKPENLLIDDELNVYLVDFGFARLGGGNIAASSVVKGTMGFMPPEQMFNRELTKASDLYGLGITLICLLTGTKSVDVGNLIDANYSIHFRHLVPPLQQGWMNWLERMVAPRLQDRYKSAADALAVLESLDVSRLPKVRIERDRLNFTPTEYGEILTKTLAISNPIPDTMLCGRWEVAPHPNDPPHTPYDHSWISVEPQTFESNNIECSISVDTQKLLASKTYKRQIILRANSEPETHTIELQVTTASLPVPQKTNSLSVCRLAFIGCFILAGFMCEFIFLILIDYLNWIAETLLGVVIVGSAINVTILTAALILALTSLLYKIVHLMFNHLMDEQIARQIIGVDAAKIVFLCAGFCMSLGLLFYLFLKVNRQLEWVEPMEIIAVGGTTMLSLAGTAIPLLDLIVFKPKRIIANYHKSEPNLIKP
jgi:hypothetical protein